MASKREKVHPIHQVIEDRYLTVDDVCNILGVSSSQVYLYDKFGLIRSIDISVNGNGGPKTRRYSLNSVKDFIKNREMDQDADARDI